MRAPIDSPASPSRGFTLIEVAVALLVISMGMLAAIEAVSDTASKSARAREKTLAHWVAMNRLTEMRLEASPPRVAKSSDEVEMGGRRWKWTAEVQPTALESMRRIDVSVRPAETDEEYSTASVTGFYGAAIAPPGTTVVTWTGMQGGGAGGEDIPERATGDKPPPVNEEPSEATPVEDQPAPPGETQD